ncbi:hypothetical protein [Pedobacter jamesrossensis]|uniref:Uncharacterized protein n=1 Tax=Pedobacter jamesrossensis TaxID=1908238 RepID=A0ABV8NF53_9SPHI
MKTKDYDRNVFINCAFDGTFLNIFRAIVYTIHDCGFIARCALETGNGEGVRIDKIVKIIQDCRYGIHDLSCVEITDDSPLPRYNMPYELGIFMGCKYYGESHHKKKNFLVLDSEPHRYKRMISDLAGYDFPAHMNDVLITVGLVRDWLSEAASKKLPGTIYYIERYQRFMEVLPLLCQSMKADVNTLGFKDYYALVSVWIQNENSKMLDED